MASRSQSAELARLRADLVTANHIAYHERLFEAFGHVSVRLRSTDRFCIASRISPALVTENQLLVMDTSGEVLEGQGRPNMEFWIHAGIYRARPDVQVVVHAHPPYSVIVGSTGQTVRPLFITGTIFTEPIPVYKPFHLVNSPERGAAVAEALGAGRAMLLRGHGVNVTGRTIQEAVVAAIYLEEAALYQWRAQAIGQPEFLTQAELDETGPVAFDQMSYDRAWNFYLSRLPASATS